MHTREPRRRVHGMAASATLFFCIYPRNTEATGKQSIGYVCNLCQASHKLLFDRQRLINPSRPYQVELHVPHPRRESRAALSPKCSPTTNNHGRKHAPNRAEDEYPPRPPTCCPASRPGYRMLPKDGFGNKTTSGRRLGNRSTWPLLAEECLDSTTTHREHAEVNTTRPVFEEEYRGDKITRARFTNESCSRNYIKSGTTQSDVCVKASM